MKVKDEGNVLLLAGTVENITVHPKSTVIIVDGEKAVFFGKSKSRLEKAGIEKGDAIIAKGFEGSYGDFMGLDIRKKGAIKTDNYIVMRCKIRSINDPWISTEIKLPIAIEFASDINTISEGCTATLMCSKKYYRYCNRRSACMDYSPSECMACTSAERKLGRIIARKIN